MNAFDLYYTLNSIDVILSMGLTLTQMVFFIALFIWIRVSTNIAKKKADTLIQHLIKENEAALENIKAEARAALGKEPWQE